MMYNFKVSPIKGSDTKSKMAMKNERMTLRELAQASGVPRRTIRFYIARGLMAGPEGLGRAATYTPEHLEQVNRIRKMQKEGRTLAEIRETLQPHVAEIAPMEFTAWWHCWVAPDVMVAVKRTASPWRMRQIQSGLAALAGYLKHGHRGEEDGSKS